MTGKREIMKRIEEKLDNVLVCYGNAEPDKIIVQSDSMVKPNIKNVMEEFPEWQLTEESPKGEELDTKITIQIAKILGKYLRNYK